MIRLQYEIGGKPYNVYRVLVHGIHHPHQWYVIAQTADSAEAWVDGQCAGETAIKRHAAAELVADHCFVVTNDYAVAEDCY